MLQVLGLLAAHGSKSYGKTSSLAHGAPFPFGFSEVESLEVVEACVRVPMKYILGQNTL